MLKKILRASALASVLAMGIGLPAGAAFAYTEEDAAVPPGAFTSDMPVPEVLREGRHFAGGHHMHARWMMMRRAQARDTDAR